MKHVAIIMDGNRRWAREKKMPSSYGHKKGAENLLKLASHIFKKGVRVLSLFAFSTENFKRSEEEVNYLMELFIEYASKYLGKLKKEGVKIVFSGSRENLSPKVLEALEKTEDTLKEGDKVLNICFNYGGRSEIIRAVKRIIKARVKEEDINEESFKNYLDYNLPDIDLLIRTSGEMRLSNFMLYQLSYAELFFTKTYFPDFNNEEYDKIEEAYMKMRDRRFGK